MFQVLVSERLQLNPVWLGPGCNKLTARQNVPSASGVWANHIQRGIVLRASVLHFYARGYKVGYGVRRERISRSRVAPLQTSCHRSCATNSSIAVSSTALQSVAGIVENLNGVVEA